MYSTSKRITSFSMPQDALTHFLSNMNAGNVPHACFISCSDSSVALRIARQAAARFCHVETVSESPDILEVSAPLRIDALRTLLEELSKRTFLGGGRAVLIANAHTLDKNVQNVLLKSLEEPPSGTLFLLTGELSVMLPTVRSRCAVLRLSSGGEETLVSHLMEAGASPKEAKLWAAASGGLEEEALRLHTEPEYRALRAQALELLGDVLSGKHPFDKTRKHARDKVAPDVVRFWLSFLGDMLRETCHAPYLQNPDYAVELSRMASSFTSGAIACMIDLSGAAAQRLDTNASAALTLDRLLIDLQEARNR